MNVSTFALVKTIGGRILRNIGVRAGGADENPLVPQSIHELHRGFRIGGFTDAIFDHLDAEEQASAAHVADRLVALRQSAELVHHNCADLSGIAHEIVALDHLQRCSYLAQACCRAFVFPRRCGLDSGLREGDQITPHQLERPQADVLKFRSGRRL